MDRKAPRLALTCGEPAGIGPDICLADQDLLSERARRLALPMPQAGGGFTIEHFPLAQAATPGRLDPRNAGWVLGLLDRALDGCRSGEFDAMITAPVQKSVINDAGIAFTGHTEYLAERCGVDRPVMLLAAGTLRVALATTHLPLHEVSAAVTATLLDEVLDVLQRDLISRWEIPAPRIAVCGLNPHAGESGHLGREEIETIQPAIARARGRGINVTGPWPADTLFTPRQLQHCDAVLAMFHDQGLPVLKYAGFGHAVNVTLGLPLVRTSVDHGTALDLAGTGRAEHGSLVAALELAAKLARAGGA